MSECSERQQRNAGDEARAGRPEYVFLTRAHERMRGLMFRCPDAKVRVLVPCSSVHTLGMTHELDIAFIDKNGTVLATYRRVGKRRRLRCSGARMTMERFADERPWFTAGDRVSLESIQ